MNRGNNLKNKGYRQWGNRFITLIDVIDFEYLLQDDSFKERYKLFDGLFMIKLEVLQSFHKIDNLYWFLYNQKSVPVKCSFLPE